MLLKHIPYDISDKENIIDLINYNFDQFFANSYGAPGGVGAGGAAGAAGAVGSTGAIGLVGGTGNTGNTGIDGNLEWSTGHVAVNNSSIIVPKSTTSYSTKATALIGTATAVANDDDFVLNISGVSATGADQSFNTNISITSSGSYFDISLHEDALSLRFDSAGQSNVLKLISADGLTFEEDGGADIAVFDAGGSTISKSIDFTGNLTLGKAGGTNYGLTIGAGIGTITTGHLIKSTDGVGSLQTVPLSEMGTGVKVGTVVPLERSYFTNDTFPRSSIAVTQTIAQWENWETDLGKGKTGTDYEGWYLCHGYTWYNTGSQVAYNTPDFAKRSFNTATATFELQNDERWRIAGGGHSRLYDNSGSSSHGSGDFDWRVSEPAADNVWIYEDTNSPPSNHNNTTAELLAMHHIVYLGRDDLKWKFTDTGNIGNFTGNNPEGYIGEYNAFNWFDVGTTPTVDNSGWLGTGMGGTFSGSYHEHSRPINLFRKRNMGAGTAVPKICTGGEGPLYISPGRMAPTGWYRVTENPANIGGKYFAQFYWTLETMTLSSITYSSVQ